MSNTTSSTTNEVPLTYKYLLAFSTLSAVFFCWLYVTKPTSITPAAPISAEPSIVTQEAEVTPEPTAKPSSFAALTQNSLPGDTDTAPVNTDPTAQGAPIPLAQSPATSGKVGWEETNDRVQHVLTAQNNTTSERIILEVPVIFQTRGLRFDKVQAGEASRILRALKIYQGQINKLHTDGKNIQHAWNSLLLKAQPIDALRADSPSLPKDPAQHPSTLSENSAATITISQ